MKKFELYKDSKYTVWHREHFSIEAETLDEAIKKITSEEAESYYNEFLYDTSEHLTPEENDGFATEEIYQGIEQCYKNGY